MSGAVSGPYWAITSPVTVDFSSSGKGFSSSMTLSSPDSSQSQSGSYYSDSIDPGSYTVVVTFETPNAWSPVAPATYSVTGGAQGVVADNDQYTASSPSTHTLTFNGVPVGAAHTIVDIYLGDGG